MLENQIFSKRVKKFIYKRAVSNFYVFLKKDKLNVIFTFISTRYCI